MDQQTAPLGSLTAAALDALEHYETELAALQAEQRAQWIEENLHAATDRIEALFPDQHVTVRATCHHHGGLGKDDWTDLHVYTRDPGPVPELRFRWVTVDDTTQHIPRPEPLYRLVLLAACPDCGREHEYGWNIKALHELGEAIRSAGMPCYFCAAGLAGSTS